MVDALVARADDSVGRDVRVALARTASWLLDAPDRTPHHPQTAAPSPAHAVRHGQIATAAPALAEYPDYALPAPAHGAVRPARRQPTHGPAWIRKATNQPRARLP
ncbi:hypothetical protein [Nocardia sp. NBC_01730]|uniref:hypothetical protein n=1 Tax=Nocardia sp. NBC_01730 TaxID=2975998 RepID=UPI002E0DE69F